MQITKSHLLNLAMVMALLGTAIAGYHFSPLVLPRADVTGIAEPGCDLQRKACLATLPDGGRIELSIAPRPIPFLAPLRVEVMVSGVNPRKIEVDFAGATMNMGYNRRKLAAIGAGHHAGEASLPVCVSGSMTWVVTVMIETDRQRIAVPYRFDVGH